MEKVILVTVNYNTAEDTSALLHSLEKLDTDGFSFESIVVDNGSKHQYSLPDKIKKENICIIRSEENTGFSGGYNLGMKDALKNGADYVLILNNDTLVDPDCVKNLISVLKKDSQIGAVVPKIYFAKGHEFHKDRYKHDELGKVFWYAGGYMDWANVTSIHRGVDEVDNGQYDKEESVDFATGCCVMFKREVLETVGLFDDNFFLYYEDADLSLRIQTNGYKVMYVPSAVVYHVNAASSGGAGNELQDYFLTRNQMLFGMKYAPIRSKIALLRQSFRLLQKGRKYQKLAIEDYYKRKFGKGSFFNK